MGTGCIRQSRPNLTTTGKLACDVGPRVQLLALGLPITVLDGGGRTRSSPRYSGFVGGLAEGDLGDFDASDEKPGAIHDQACVGPQAFWVIFRVPGAGPAYLSLSRDFRYIQYENPTTTAVAPSTVMMDRMPVWDPNNTFNMPCLLDSLMGPPKHHASGAGLS